MVDLRKFYFHSGFDVDKIIGTFEGSFTATAPAPLGSPTISTTTFSTNIPETTFFQGIYSIDGGTSWLKFNTDSSGVPLASQANTYGRSNTGSFTVTARNFTTAAPVAFTVQYKLALIAKPNQGDITPQPTANAIVFNSKDNYLKIILDEPVALSLSAGASIKRAFVHSRGYFPQAIAYFELDAPVGTLPAGLYELDSVMTFLAASTANNETDTASASSGIYITTNSVVASIKAGASGFSGTLFVRIYGDD